MIIKIFETIGLRAYIASFGFSFAVITLIDFCKNYPQWGIENIPDIVIFWLAFVLFTLYVSYLQTQKFSSKLSGINLLTFPLVFLFFPIGSGLVFHKILIGILLVFSKNLFVNARHSKFQNKNLFDLSLAISVIVLFNTALAVFYVLPLWLFLNQKLLQVKSLIALIFPAVLIPFTFHGIAILFSAEQLMLFDHALKIDLWNYSEQTNAEWIWFGILSIAIYITLFKRPRGPEQFSEFLFMATWLYLSLIIGFLGLQIGQGRWLLSFIPAAFFVGIFIERTKSDASRNTLIFFGIVFMVLFKLFDFGVLTI